MFVFEFADLTAGEGDGVAAGPWFTAGAHPARNKIEITDKKINFLLMLILESV
jgi:hypothetical protein